MTQYWRSECPLCRIIIGDIVPFLSCSSYSEGNKVSHIVDQKTPDVPERYRDAILHVYVIDLLCSSQQHVSTVLCCTRLEGGPSRKFLLSGQSTVYSKMVTELHPFCG